MGQFLTLQIATFQTVRREQQNQATLEICGSRVLLMLRHVSIDLLYVEQGTHLVLIEPLCQMLRQIDQRETLNQ